MRRALLLSVPFAVSFVLVAVAFLADSAAVFWLGAAFLVLGLVLVAIFALIRFGVWAARDSAASRKGYRHVTAGDLGDAWPLTVDHGTVRRHDEALTFAAPDSTEYALNGVAASRGFPEIEPIWKPAPHATADLPSRMNIKPLRDLAP